MNPFDEFIEYSVEDAILESFDSSLEGIVETISNGIKKIYKAIKDFIVRIYNWFKSFFGKSSGGGGKKKNAKVKEAAAKDPSAKVKVVKAGDSKELALYSSTSKALVIATNAYATTTSPNPHGPFSDGIKKTCAKIGVDVKVANGIVVAVKSLPKPPSTQITVAKSVAASSHTTALARSTQLTVIGQGIATQNSLPEALDKAEAAFYAALKEAMNKGQEFIAEAKKYGNVKMKNLKGATKASMRILYDIKEDVKKQAVVMRTIEGSMGGAVIEGTARTVEDDTRYERKVRMEKRRAEFGR